MNVIEKLKRFCIYVLVIIAVMFSYEKLSASKERKGGKSLLKPSWRTPDTRLDNSNDLFEGVDPFQDVDPTPSWRKGGCSK